MNELEHALSRLKIFPSGRCRLIWRGYYFDSNEGVYGRGPKHNWIQIYAAPHITIGVAAKDPTGFVLRCLHVAKHISGWPYWEGSKELHQIEDSDAYAAALDAYRSAL